jgi:hypothetical protein
MRLNPAAFNRHIEHMGQQVTWRKAFACPCRNPNSGAADPRCPHCAGKGQLWNPPKDGVIGVTGSRTQREWAQFGTYESGDSVVSIPESSPLYEMGQFDRVTLLNAAEQFSLPLVRGAPTDRLIGRVEKISRVFWLDAQKHIVEGGIPQVQANGTLAWDAGAPPAGTQYTISGSRYPEFFCFGAFPSNRNEHQGARLPKRVVLRRFDLWGRSSPSGSP